MDKWKVGIMVFGGVLAAACAAGLVWAVFHPVKDGPPLPDPPPMAGKLDASKG